MREWFARKCCKQEVLLFGNVKQLVEHIEVKRRILMAAIDDVKKAQAGLDQAVGVLQTWAANQSGATTSDLEAVAADLNAQTIVINGITGTTPPAGG